MKSFVFAALGILLLMSGCADKRSDCLLDKKILSPESVEVYDVSVDNIWPNINNGRKLLKQFPFVSYKPILDFNGKFSYQFYDKIDYRYKAAPLKDVDFWKLRTNPFLEDFIYVLPTWANEFKRISNDLFEDIGYSYNLSSKEQEILKWWISQGGILWIEGGIYSTRYDTFKKSGEIDEKAITQKLITKCKNLTFLNHKVKTYLYKSKKIDFINYKPLKISYKVYSQINYFKDIKNLQIVTDNFLSADFMPVGDYLLKSTNNKPLVSFIRYGKGGVVFLRPFEFQDKRYDGELLRWKLLHFLLNKKYLNSNLKYEIVKERFDNNQHITLHNLHFAYKSYQLLPSSIKLLEPIANYLKAHKNYKIKIIGHTDNIGSKKYNYNLSLQRANAVKRALIEMGISKDRIFTYGYGEDRPIASNKTKEGRAKNRRVEFVIIKE